MPKSAGRGASHITDWILEKYPDACPVCGEKPCLCPSFRDEAETRHEDQGLPGGVQLVPYWRVRGSIRCKSNRNKMTKSPSETPWSLEELSKMFGDIYSGAHYDTPMDSICFHLFEEIGEVAEIIMDIDSLENAGKTRDPESGKLLMGLRRELQFELADVFSWMTAMVHKLDSAFLATHPHYGCEMFFKQGRKKAKGLGRPEYNPVTLTDMIIKQYAQDETFRCPACGEEACNIKCIQNKIALDAKTRESRRTTLAECEKRLWKENRPVFDTLPLGRKWFFRYGEKIEFVWGEEQSGKPNKQR